MEIEERLIKRALATNRVVLINNGRICGIVKSDFARQIIK